MWREMNNPTLLDTLSSTDIIKFHVVDRLLTSQHRRCYQMNVVVAVIMLESLATSSRQHDRCTHGIVVKLKTSCCSPFSVVVKRSVLNTRLAQEADQTARDVSPAWELPTHEQTPRNENKRQEIEGRKGRHQTCGIKWEENGSVKAHSGARTPGRNHKPCLPKHKN